MLKCTKGAPQPWFNLCYVQLCKGCTILLCFTCSVQDATNHNLISASITITTLLLPVSSSSFPIKIGSSSVLIQAIPFNAHYSATHSVYECNISFLQVVLWDATNQSFISASITITTWLLSVSSNSFPIEIESSSALKQVIPFNAHYSTAHSVYKCNMTFFNLWYIQLYKGYTISLCFTANHSLK